MDEQQYRAAFEEDCAVGWEAIDRELDRVYQGREPRHYGSINKYSMGGEDPLDGASIYDCADPVFHRHIVSYGMSELYFSPESAGKDYSGWGFEFTMRLTPFAQDPAYNDAEHERRIIDLLRKDNPLLITDLTRRHSHIPQ
ncbi:MAG: suppressor of fused domain protein [Neisseria sp.]|nr:suppressor of fused domain protein [Neisseria sp.]